MAKNKYISIQIIIITLFALFVFPNIVRHGMFQDGVIYATIGRNMAVGIGSFWSPKFTETFFSSFYEHPPLSMGIQSLFFRVFGNDMFVERIFISLVAIISLLLIISIWKLVFKDKENLSRFWFFPAFLWLIDENTFLSYAANLLDCVMGMITLSAVYLLLKSMKTKSELSKVIYIIAGSVLIFGATLTKGPVGFFPLAFFLIYFISFKNINLKKVIWYSSILIGTLIVAYGILLSFSAPKEYLTKYLNIQVLAALAGKRMEGLHSRWYIIRRFIEMGLAPIILTLIIYSRTAWKRKKIDLIHKKEFLFFILTALSASLPIVISPKQMGFYLVPAQPFFYLAFAALILPSISSYFEKITLKKSYHRIIKLMTIGLIIFTVIFIGVNVGKINKRDKFLIPDINEIAKVTGEHTVVGCKSLVKYWDTIGYFYRYHYISIDNKNYLDHNYLLVSQKADTISYPEFSKVVTNTTMYNLYKKVK